MELGRRLGGHSEFSDELGYTCTVFPGNVEIHYLTDYIDEFLDLIRKHRREIDAETHLEFASKLIGGFPEKTYIGYDPDKRRFMVGATLASDYGEEEAALKEAAAPTTSKRVRTQGIAPILKGEGYVDWNDATWSYFGVGEAHATISEKTLRKASDPVSALSKLLDEAIDMASRLSNEAMEESEWEPPEEEFI